MSMRWDIRMADGGSDELDELLKAGWEPFALTVEKHFYSEKTQYQGSTYEQTVVYLKRKIEEPRPWDRKET